MEPKSLLLEAQQVTVMYSQVGVGNYFTLPRNTHGSWFCFAPSSSFLASCTKSISLQAAFLACWTLFFRVVFSFAFFLATSPKEPAAPDWATLCLPRPGGPGLTNLPVLSLQMLTASILCHYIYRPGLHHHTEKEGGNDYSDNSDSLSSKNDFSASRMIQIIVLILSHTLSLEPWPLHSVALVKIWSQWQIFLI